MVYALNIYAGLSLCSIEACLITHSDHTDCIKSFINGDGSQFCVSNRLTIDILCVTCQQGIFVEVYQLCESTMIKYIVLYL